MKTCWFCKKNPEDPTQSIEVPIYKEAKMNNIVALNLTAIGFALTDPTPMWQRVMGAVCLVGMQVIFAFLGGVASKAKGYHPAIGWALGFFLGFLGCWFILTWEGKDESAGTVSVWKQEMNPKQLWEIIKKGWRN